MKSAVDAPMTSRRRERRSAIAQAVEHGDLTGKVWTLQRGLS
jgi:hypothetical protein